MKVTVHCQFLWTALRASFSSNIAAKPHSLWRSSISVFCYIKKRHALIIHLFARNSFEPPSICEKMASIGRGEMLATYVLQCLIRANMEKNVQYSSRVLSLAHSLTFEIPHYENPKDKINLYETGSEFFTRKLDFHCSHSIFSSLWLKRQKWKDILTR